MSTLPVTTTAAASAIMPTANEKHRDVKAGRKKKRRHSTATTSSAAIADGVTVTTITVSTGEATGQDAVVSKSGKRRSKENNVGIPSVSTVLPHPESNAAFCSTSTSSSSSSTSALITHVGRRSKEPLVAKEEINRWSHHVILVVASYLGPKDVSNFMATCKEFRDAVDDEPPTIFRSLERSKVAPVKGASMVAQLLHLPRWRFLRRVRIGDRRTSCYADTEVATALGMLPHVEDVEIIRALRLENTGIKRFTEGIVKNGNHLKRLVLTGCPEVTAASLPYVGTLTGLKALELCIPSDDSNPTIDQAWNQCIRGLTILEKLVLTNNSSLHNVQDMMLHLAPSLLRLDLSSCPNITDDGFVPILTTLTRLTHLDLSFTGATNGTMRAIGESLPHLEVLKLKRVGISDVGVVSVAAGCPNLCEASFSDMSELTDAGVLAFVQGCRHLRILNLYKCRGITDFSLESMQQYCTELESVNLFGCDDLSVAGVNAFTAAVPSLTTLMLPMHLPETMLHAQTRSLLYRPTAQRSSPFEPSL